MNIAHSLQSAVRWLAAGVGLAASAYASYIGITWLRYGNPRHLVNTGTEDSLLDQYIPNYEVVEHHEIRVAAPAEIAFDASCEMDIEQSVLVRAIFRTRALFLGSEEEQKVRSLGLAEQAKAWGWGVLAQNPGREIVFGGVTQPWLANPAFRALPPDEFRGFQEPGYVKIAWTLRADPVDGTNSMVRTETRATATDPDSRAKFRRYWSIVMPGTALIRRFALRLVKADAERRARGMVAKLNVSS